MDKEPFYLIIPAAGLSSRTRTINPDLPKEMLPVLHKPAIQYSVAEGISAGIKNIVIIISRQKEIIRQYFEDKTLREDMFPLACKEVEEIKNKCSITFLYQKKPAGESDAIGLAGDIAGSHSVAIIYPDNIYMPFRNESPAPGVLNDMRSVFIKYNKDVIALMEVTKANAPGISNSGRVDVKHIQDCVFDIRRLHAKREGSFVPRFKKELRTCGIQISGPHIFHYIKRLQHTVREKEFTDMPVRSLILKEKGLLGCRIRGTVFDIGNPKGYGLSLKYTGEKS